MTKYTHLSTSAAAIKKRIKEFGTHLHSTTNTEILIDRSQITINWKKLYKCLKKKTKHQKQQRQQQQ